MLITDELVRYLEELSRIKLPQELHAKTKEDLQSILTYIDTLAELDTEGVEPMSHAFPVKNVFREDEVRPSTDRNQILANAPAKKDGCFVVPKTFE